MAQAALSLDTIDIVGNDTFAKNGYPHEAWTLLRREAPVFWYDRGVKVPFWAITKHADIMLASRLEHVELAGPVERLRSSFLGGVKHMPIRYRLCPGRA